MLLRGERREQVQADDFGTAVAPGTYLSAGDAGDHRPRGDGGRGGRTPFGILASDHRL